MYHIRGMAFIRCCRHDGGLEIADRLTEDGLGDLWLKDEKERQDGDGRFEQTQANMELGHHHLDSVTSAGSLTLFVAGNASSAADLQNAITDCMLQRC